MKENYSSRQLSFTDTQTNYAGELATPSLANPMEIVAKLEHYLSQTYGLDHRREIAVLLSGGVDSSVVLASLKNYGCQKLTAYYLKIWLQEDAQFLGECPWEDDLSYAAAVCEQLDIPLQVLPLQQQYYDYVVSYTIDELCKGRTPSPDLFCNEGVKFGAFLQQLKPSNDKALQPLVASGHYALLVRISQLMNAYSSLNQKDITNEILLQQAPDLVKDQSYFLSRLGQSQLQNLLFPLGCLYKAEVRSLAQYWGLATAQRKDSQGICFLGKIKFRDFAKQYLGEKLGPIVELETNRELGQHRGLWFHTIGQRQGLGLSGGPWYVCAKDMLENRLYVSRQYSDSQLLRSFWVEQPHWLQSNFAWHSLALGPLQLKLRHGPTKIACQLQQLNDCWHVVMERGDRGVAPGQFAVFYRGDICLGSAAITLTELNNNINYDR